MKLFCSGCQYFFDDNETIHKVESGSMFFYYHEACLDVADKVVATLSLKKMLEALEGKYEGQKMFRKTCKYDKCKAVFVTKTRTREFCNEECNRLHFNEINMLRNRKARLQKWSFANIP